MVETADTKIAVIDSEVQTLKKSDDDQWQAINELRQYMHKLIPIWTALVLTVFGAITGSALTFAGMVIRMSGK